jgi:ATP-dependent exoDNAse (exonuclease V) beta subunit
MNFQESYTALQTVLKQVNNDSELFVQALHHQNLPYLSYSQITTVEFCQQRYYLQYILGQQPEPLPDYFTKGKRLHELIAQTYQGEKDGAVVSLEDLHAQLAASKEFCDLAHLANALNLHQQHRWQAERVLAVEHPFAILLAEDLPPLVGVIDLVLKDGNAIILVDHKTGRNFYPYDELQVAIYAHYIRTIYPDYDCRLYYDHYRWVNNLQRIRKPAFQRTLVQMQPALDVLYRQRIYTAAGIIQRMHAGAKPSHAGACFRCPFQKNCEFSYRK